MPPVRVLLVDDLVMRAEALALGLSAHPEIVVVGRLRVHDPQLAQRCAAAPADVAVVALVDARDFETGSGVAAQESGADGTAAESERLLDRVTVDLLGSRPGMRLIALVDPRDGGLIDALERSPEWSWLTPSSSLEELAMMLMQTANDPST